MKQSDIYFTEYVFCTISKSTYTEKMFYCMDIKEKKKITLQKRG